MGSITYNGFKLNVENFQAAMSFLKKIKPEFEKLKNTIIKEKLVKNTVKNIDYYIAVQNGYSPLSFMRKENFQKIHDDLNNIDAFSLYPHLRCFVDDIKNIFSNYYYQINNERPISYAWQQLKIQMESERTPYRVTDGLDTSMSVFLFEKDGQFYLQLPIKDIRKAKAILLQHPEIEDFSYFSDNEDIDIPKEEYQKRYELWSMLSKYSLNEGLEYVLSDNQLLHYPKDGLEEFIPSLEKRAKFIGKEITKIIIPKDVNQDDAFTYIHHYIYSDEYKKEIECNTQKFMNLLPELNENNLKNDYSDFNQKKIISKMS